jgi:hypothetical protein
LVLKVAIFRAALPHCDNSRRIVREEIARRGWSAAELEQRRKADAEKIKISPRTTMTWAWIAERLAMGTSGYTADCLRKT